MTIAQRAVTPEQAGQYAQRALDGALGYKRGGTPAEYAEVLRGLLSNPAVIPHLNSQNDSGR